MKVPRRGPRRFAGHPAVPIRRPLGPARRGAPHESAASVIAVRPARNVRRHRTVLYLTLQDFNRKRLLASWTRGLHGNTNVAEFPTAYYLLEGLNEIGIDYLFCNFGTDHAPIIEAMARRARRGEAGAESGALPAREHRRAHGGGLCDRHRPRPGRAGACRCRHRQHGDGDAQSLPQPPAGAADGRQGALHHARRAGRHARHLRAFRAGAVRPGEPGAALHQVGMDTCRPASSPRRRCAAPTRSCRAIRAGRSI